MYKAYQLTVTQPVTAKIRPFSMVPVLRTGPFFASFIDDGYYPVRKGTHYPAFSVVWGWPVAKQLGLLDVQLFTPGNC